ncbi:MAG: hypothetical protein J6Z29_09760, partial [Ruminococcus sp.]|nr:hypothetical protein [Ruminococcus sp.]
IGTVSGETTYAVYEEKDSGTVEILGNTTGYGQDFNSYTFTPNSVIKIYTDKAITIRTGGETIQVTSECTLTYSYSNWDENLTKN